MITSPRVALYMRVSTAEQSFGIQEAALRDYCRRKGWKQTFAFREKKSGVKAARTQLANLMTAVRAGRIDVVLVYKLDRFGRSSLHLLQLVEEMKKYGVAFISATEPIDTSDENPMAQLVIEMMAAWAGFERGRILERSRAGFKAARARGVKIGRPRKNDGRIARAIKLAETITNRSEIARRSGLSLSYVIKILDGKRRVAAGGR